MVKLDSTIETWPNGGIQIFVSRFYRKSRIFQLALLEISIDSN